MSELRNQVAQKWRWLLLGDATRREVDGLVDKLHVAQLEIEALKKKLHESTVAESKATANVRRLWNFIALRNKPIDSETIKSLLDRLNTQKT